MKLVIVALIMTLFATGNCSDFDKLLEKVKKSTQDNTGAQDGILAPEEEVLEMPALGLEM